MWPRNPNLRPRHRPLLHRSAQLRRHSRHPRSRGRHPLRRADPNRAASRSTGNHAGATVHRLRPEAIADDSYRFHCFDLPALVDRLSLVTPHRGLLYCVNLYRCASTGPFPEAEISAVQASAPLLASLAIKHDEVTHRRPSPNDRSARVADLVERLAAMRKKLTPRELEVARASSWA